MSSILEWTTGFNDEWMFYLGGYAGTGKTTLLQEVINRLPEAPTCLAPTGKAASVLQKKLKNAQVTTIHSALYKPVIPDMSELQALEEELRSRPGAEDLARAIGEEKERLADLPLRFIDNLAKAIEPGDLVMVDEASMVTEKMVNDLRATRAKVLFVGDPGQLPPVNDTGYFLKRNPDAMLSTIHRQALGNPIIELSMKVRTGEPIPGQIANPHVVRKPKAGYPISELSQADQVLSGMNVVRRRINRGIRKCRGYEGVFPLEGEKLICLKNRFNHGWIVNGMQCLAASRLTSLMDCHYMDVLYEGQLLRHLQVYDYPFRVHYQERAMEEPWAARHALAEFDYGYAITVHKAQGSEWDSVVLVDDGLFSNRQNDRRKWLYTAITRAKEHLTWLT